MKSGTIKVLVALVILVTVIAILGAEARARSSALSTASDGLRLAFAWLESRGTPVELLDAPLGYQSEEDLPTEAMLREAEASVALEALEDREAEARAPVLVLAFPWQSFPAMDTGEKIVRHLRRGGAVIYAYEDGEAGVGSSMVLRAIGLISGSEPESTDEGEAESETPVENEAREETSAPPIEAEQGAEEEGAEEETESPDGPELYLPSELREAAPLSPVEWWRYHTTYWDLPPVASGDLPTVRIPAFRLAPPLPESAPSTVLYQAPDGQPMAFAYDFLEGRVVVLPVAMLHNAHLARDDQLRLLDWLRHDLDPELAARSEPGYGADAEERSPRHWQFDEYHHGLVTAELAADDASSRAWDLLMVHLVVLYLLALLALGRRFGPPWQEAVPHQGSAAAFLHGLGELHHRLGHHADAARLLVERLGRWDPRRFAAEPSAGRPHGASKDPGSIGSGEALLQYAQEIHTAAGSPATTKPSLETASRKTVPRKESPS